MKNYIYFAFGLFLLASCGQSSDKPIESDISSEKVQQEKTLPDDSYKILSEIENVNSELNINKCNIEIELKEKRSKEELTIIANKLHETRMSYDKLWIFYYLPGMNVGSGAWATTHFTPDLQVDILGTTTEEEIKLNEKANDFDGKLIGEFYEQQFTSASYTVYEKNNKTFIKMTFKDGSSANDEMKRKPVKKGTRFDYKAGNSSGEYFILTKSDILEFYNKENKMFTSANRTK